MVPDRMRATLVLALTSLTCGCTSPAADPDWVRAFGYESADVHSIDVGEFGFPYLTARIGDTPLPLAFDTGKNRAGIDPDLPEPILVGVGSDILSRFVWTVDYEAGVLWIPARDP